eukprot:COSAG04_NODE_1824_length_5487_cov_1.894395_3_plen_110_part_00
MLLVSVVGHARARRTLADYNINDLSEELVLVLRPRPLEPGVTTKEILLLILPNKLMDSSRKLKLSVQSNLGLLSTKCGSTWPRVPSASSKHSKSNRRITQSFRRIHVGW